MSPYTSRPMTDRTIRFMKALALLLCLLLPSISRAESLRGFIQKSSGQRYLEVQNDNGTKSLLQITTTTEPVRTSLNKLKAGDYLVARGTVDIESKSVQVEAIESLGLHALVGAWTSDRREVYDFRDFSRLTLYIPSGDAKTNVVKAGEFRYAVTPDQGAQYSIFLSDNQSVTIGSIEFKKSRLMLKVVDPSTGEVSSELSLSPLAGSHPLK